jgi:hypothetical protein
MMSAPVLLLSGRPFPKGKIFVSFFSSAFAYFCVSRFFFVQDFDQILRLVGLKRTLVSRDLSHTHTRA